MAIVTILIYELVMIVFKLDGLSFFKIFITALVWVSFFIALISFLEDYKVLKKDIPKLAFNLILLLIFWNIFCVFRSLFFNVGTLTTLFGNVYTSLAVLIPFIIIFSLKKINIKILHNYFIRVMQLGIILFLVFLGLGGTSFNETQILILLLLLQPTIFLITILSYQNKNSKALIFICSVLLFIVAFMYSNRTMMVREVLLFIGFVAVYLYYKFKLRWILRISFLLLFLPSILIVQSLYTGESAFSVFLARVSDNEMSTDTRTFLYTELFDDLVDNNQLIIGKSANGKYYSEYFSTEEGDSENRLGMEVGVLTMLLKGGLIAVVLNLIILIFAIYLAFFRSNNYYVVGVGYMLFIHTILLFIDNRIGYTTYNFVIWFFIGVCFSKEIRRINNIELARLFYPKKKIS